MYVISCNKAEDHHRLTPYETLYEPLSIHNYKMINVYIFAISLVGFVEASALAFDKSSHNLIIMLQKSIDI